MFEQSVTVILATLAIFFAQSFYIVREILDLLLVTFAVFGKFADLSKAFSVN